jgi:TonB family protein
MRAVRIDSMKITIVKLLSALTSEIGMISEYGESKKTMTALKPGLMAATILALACSHAVASGVKVIANPSVKADSISVSELKSVFLEEKSSLAGGHVEPVLARRGTAHDAFLQMYMGRTDSDLQTYYRSLVFTGRGSMPRAFGSDGEVAAYVASTRGAIGYISSESNVEGVRILAVVGSENSSARRLTVRIEPDYPEVLRGRLIGGTVRLWVTIAPSGSVTQVEVRGGDAVLGEAAAQAVAKWKYSAARSETSTEVAITFDPKVGTR